MLPGEILDNANVLKNLICGVYPYIRGSHDFLLHLGELLGKEEIQWKDNDHH